jgi:hypothetical protein
MRALREVGPTAAASLSVLVACWGIAHEWPTQPVRFFFYFGGFVCIASLIERAASYLVAQWRTLVEP